MPTVAEAQSLQYMKGRLYHYHISYQRYQQQFGVYWVSNIAKLRQFLCVSAMRVEHVAGLHAFTAKQQQRRKQKDGNSTSAVLAKSLESVTGWYAVRREFGQTAQLH